MLWPQRAPSRPAQRTLSAPYATPLGAIVRTSPERSLAPLLLLTNGSHASDLGRGILCFTVLTLIYSFSVYTVASGDA